MPTLSSVVGKDESSHPFQFAQSSHQAGTRHRLEKESNVQKSEIEFDETHFCTNAKRFIDAPVEW